MVFVFLTGPKIVSWYSNSMKIIKNSHYVPFRDLLTTLCCAAYKITSGVVRNTRSLFSVPEVGSRCHRKWVRSILCLLKKRKLTELNCKKPLSNYKKREITGNVRYLSDFLGVVSSAAYLNISVVAAQSKVSAGKPLRQLARRLTGLARLC